jgi:hypothetical protein
MMAAIAIPAFMKYIKRSKNTEATEFLGMLHRNALAYYADEELDAKGKPMRHAFPAPSVGPTPPLGTCCAGGAVKCLPDETLWTSKPTWMELHFSVDDPHYYSYEYRVAPDRQSFTVRAYGDLDCDGEYSTFELTGTPTSGPSEPTAIQPLE